ncbi:class I lanthipeptide [Chitinophaga sp. 22536]|uniref:class I lanthipeptide n=1 Tax=unclassified Chitinophaga TaxID=2619133 RepID=UPI003F86EFCD
MKKKKMIAEKKLTFGKSAVAVLSESQKEMVAGGVQPWTFDWRCVTVQKTCETIPYQQKECIYC